LSEHTYKIIKGIRQKQLISFVPFREIGFRYGASGPIKDQVRKKEYNIFVTLNLTPINSSPLNILNQAKRFIQCHSFQDALRNDLRDFQKTKIVNASLSIEELARSLGKSLKSFSFYASKIPNWDKIKSEYIEVAPWPSRVILRPIKCIRVLFSYFATRIVMNRILKEHLNADQSHVIAIWNGRYASSIAVLDLAQLNKIEVVYVETGSHMNKYELFSKSLHSLEEWSEKSQYDWNSSQLSVPERTELAINYFKNLKYDPKRNPYIRYQNHESKPRSDVQKEDKMLVYFPSSLQEYAPLADVVPADSFADQFDAFEAILNHQEFSSWKIYVRVHPSLSRKSFSTFVNDRPWLKYAKVNENVTVIRSRSSISSYSLAEKADLVVGFYTNFTAETIFWGYPTLILGPTIWGIKMKHRVALNQAALDTINLEALYVNDSDHILHFGLHQSVRGRIVSRDLFTSKKYKGALLTQLSSVKNSLKGSSHVDYTNVIAEE